MSGSQTSSALANVLALVPSVRTPAAAASLVAQALTTPRLHHFAELLDCAPLLSALGYNNPAGRSILFRTDEGPAPLAANAPTGDFPGRLSYNLLKLFAYGTYGDYVDEHANAPGTLYPAEPLPEAAIHKLRQLTVLSVVDAHASDRGRSVPYDVLMAAMRGSFATVRQLEAFLVNECMYAGLVTGQLDQERRCLDVASCVHRDLAPDGKTLASLEERLARWLKKTQGVFNTLATNEVQLKTAQTQAASHAARQASAVQQARNAARSLASSGVDDFEGVAHLLGTGAGLGRPKRGRGGVPKHSTG